MPKEYRLTGLDCPHCAAKIEKAVSEMDGVASAAVDFNTLKLRIDYTSDHDYANELPALRAALKYIDSDVGIEDPPAPASGKAGAEHI